MKKIWVVGIVLNLCILLQAQPPVKILRQGAKAATVRPSAAQQTALSRYSGAHGALMGVDYHLVRTAVPTAAAGNNLPVQQASQHSWLEQQKRNYKAYRLHQARRARDLEAQIQAQERAAREAILAKLPKANPSHQFITYDFAALLPDQIPAEELPLVAQPGVLFRGMALSTDGKAVANILQNGLRVADAGAEANTRNYAMSAGMPGIGPALAKTPLTNLTSFPLDAANWAVTRFTETKPLIVIVAVNGQTQSGKVVLAAKDIPAQNILHVFVPVNQNGKSVWSKVELAPDGGFLVTPYDIAPAAQ